MDQNIEIAIYIKTAIMKTATVAADEISIKNSLAVHGWLDAIIKGDLLVEAKPKTEPPPDAK